jgi:2-oxoglutarate dehydrogenase E2 component (dihydrolipoamide succinyltransferase)
MRHEVKVPSMGESVSEAVIGQIMKQSGSTVNQDEELLELETDKVNQVLHAPAGGKLELMVKQGDRVTIGQTVAVIEGNGGGKPAEAPKQAEAPKPGQAPQAAAAPSAPAPQMPSARMQPAQFAQEIKSPPPASAAPAPMAAPAPAPAAPPAPAQGPTGARESRQPMSRIRKVIAQRLVEVQHTAAMLTTFNEVDMSAIMKLRSEYKDEFSETHGVRLGFLSFFVKAAVSALKAWPAVNGRIEGDEIVFRHYYDIGVAVGTEKGLFVPILRNCDQLSFAQLEKTVETLAKQARDGTLTADALQGGTFTITNGGVYGSLLSTPILTPNQSAILGMHKIEKRPVVVDDEVVIRPMMYLALSYDHRIIDGREAVSFLVHMKEHLEDPARLLIDV